MIEHLGLILSILAGVGGLTLLSVVGSGVWVLHNSKHWHGIGQAFLVKQLSIEVSSVRGNFEAYKRDQLEWMRQIGEVNQQILSRLDAISSNGAKEHPLEERIREIKLEVDDIEQTLHALPCFIDRDLHVKLMEDVRTSKDKK
jgi:hypothetical protein